MVGQGFLKQGFGAVRRTLALGDSAQERNCPNVRCSAFPREPNGLLRQDASPGEVASAYLYLMTNRFINGQCLAVDGGVMLRK
jgi:NAD(P)-dependent dehydrogenase (short-subunit alcohol dehydrogenase family)